MTAVNDRWLSGRAYEAYVGRWSRHVGREFVAWLDVRPGARWLDVGCGTGILTATILERAAPGSVVGIDPSESFVEHARGNVIDDRARFAVGSASATGLGDDAVDAVVSGLVLNFVPDIAEALAEAHRVVVPGGLVAGYVWDYGERMQFMRHFWDAAVALDPGAADLDEGRRFPIAAEGPLGAAFAAAGLADVEVRPIDIPTVFTDFDDLWQPFLGGTGTAPAHLSRLSESDRAAVRDRLRATVPTEADGSIRLVARAWAARGRA